MAGQPLMEKKVDMKTKEESTVEDTSDYPYGLRISLGAKELKKLGIPGLPDVGEKLCIDADVICVGVRQTSEEDVNVEFQITALIFCNPDEEKKDASETIYGKA